MKKPLVSLALTALILSLGFIACQKYTSSSNTNTIGTNFPPDVIVTGSVQGRVVDQDGIPVQGATITSGVAGTTTDVNGVFTFKNISLSSRFGFIKAAKSGYFTGSRSIAITGGESSFVTIQLVTRTETGSFIAASGGKVAVFAGDTVAFPANALVNASTNAVYSGTVHVYATYLNPTNDNLTKYMPGDLRGITTDGKEVALQTYGMMDVEMQDDAGNKLQVASGQQATITVAIPSALQGSAAATIPMWYFNDSTGRWMQQGTGVRQGNNYIGNVTHFTWWNYDVAYVANSFKARVKDQSGNAIPYVHWIVYGPNGEQLASSYTDSTGVVNGWMPTGQTCVLKLMTECGNILGGANVGPALNDLDLGTITVTLPDMGLTVKGTVVDCSNSPVANGFVNVLIDGLNYRAVVANGQFTLPLVRCYAGSTDIQLIAGDLGTSQLSSPVTKTNVQPGTLDVGQISVCSGTTLSQFITVSFAGLTLTQSNNNNLSYNSGNFYSYTSPFLEIDVNGLSGTGSFAPSFFVMKQGGYRFAAASDNTLRVNVTGFGAVNQYITGTLSGNIYDSTSSTVYPLTGSFKLLRTN